MNGKKNRAFLFYASNLDVLERFPEDQARRIAMKIVEYGLSEESCSDDYFIGCKREERLYLKPIFDAIDAEKKRYRDVQLVESYIMKVELLAHKFPKESAGSEQQILGALKKLKTRVRREHVDNLEDVLIDITGKELSDAIGYRVYTMEERFDRAISKASMQDRALLMQARDSYFQATDTLKKYLNNKNRS